TTYTATCTVGTCTGTAVATVTVSTKPNAGQDQILPCTNPTTNTLTTTTTLAPTPTGGSWAQIGTTPATATINGNAVTNMTVAGTYQFVYTTTAACKDTIAVTVNPCTGCVKPDAGPDAPAVCQPTTTAKLTAVTAAGTWAPIGSPANPAAATIDANGNIAGMTAAGTYRFVYSITGGGIVCTDTAQVVVNAKPVIGDGTATICAGETVDLTSKITGYANLLNRVWTVATAGGTAVTTPTAVKPAATTTYVLVAENAAGCKDTANVLVTVNPKPNAGKDTTMACLNPATNQLATSITLAPIPTGGSWTQIGTTPATATINGNAVTNMTVAGTYQFVYTTTAGCKDTVAVTVSPCAGCTKPDAGPDVTLTCPPSGIAPTTATLAAVTSGGTWGAIVTNPAAATINAATGAITGLTTAGTYRFVYSVTGGGNVCTDTAAVIVPTCVQPKGSLGDFVWKDQNNNGIQDETTPNGGGVAEVQIELYKNGTFFAKDTTDVQGKYLFTNLDAGTYKIKVLAASIPAGCELSSVKDAPSADTKDSDVDKTTGESGNYEINPLDPTKKDILTVDAALYSPKGSLGDFVWKDLNNNGIQDETTPNGGGVAGVQIELYKNGTFFAKDTTDATGKYLFTNLDAGTYKIKVLSTSIPAGCELSSVKDAFSDDAKDSDVDKTTGESGNYEINPLDSTKKDILTVDAALVVPCVKSKVTLTGAPVCSADVQTYSITFSVTNKVGNLKVNKGTLTGANPYTVTGIPSGATIKITDSLSTVCKFDTLITGPNCNCNPPLPLLITPSMTACVGDTFPTIKATVVGLATVEWFTQPTGGTAVFTGLNYKPSGTVPTTGAVFYAQARSTDPTCPTAISTSRVMATVNAQDCTKEVDLALKKSINTKIAQIGDVLTYTLKVWNESNTNATGVEVTDSIATTVEFQAGSFTASRGSAAISGNVIKWTIGNIAAAGVPANGDTVTLTYKVKATQQGIHYNTAEIIKTNEKDVDSTPSNGKETEDDIDRQCFTVPIKLCSGNKVEVTVPTRLTNVKWYRNGGSTPIATGNVVLLSEIGTYTFTADNGTCPTGGCCPVILESDTNCCPAEACVPFTVKKIKK
ncbi:DUF11 domain-containing protein, partial [Runella sp. CRIBMP]|uniref:SdrD B-like domain-containing protein n=1 Tax=Runella sp. CRIBMP TaxID=2683261 RepID=UPI001412F7B0